MHGNGLAFLSLVSLFHVLLSMMLSQSRSVTVMILNGGGHAVVWPEDSRSKTAEFKRTDWGCDQYHTIGTRVSPGHHNLTVMTVRDGLLVVSGVFVGPPDT